MATVQGYYNATHSIIQADSYCESAEVVKKQKRIRVQSSRVLYEKNHIRRNK